MDLQNFLNAPCTLSADKHIYFIQRQCKIPQILRKDAEV